MGCGGGEWCQILGKIRKFMDHPQKEGSQVQGILNSAGSLRSESETERKPEVPASPRGMDTKGKCIDHIWFCIWCSATLDVGFPFLQNEKGLDTLHSLVYVFIIHL